jgi:site-specific recombinase XerD
VSTLEPRLTLAEWSRIFRTTTRDRSYEATKLGPDVLAYLAWKRHSKAAAATLDQYERDLSRLCFVGLQLEEITHAELMLVLDLFPPGSWKRVRAAWNDFFRWSIREGRRPDNPLDRLPKLRPEPKLVYDIFTPREIDLLVAASRRMTYPLLARIRALTMLESGGRALELRRLTVGDYDLYRRTITLRGKLNKERVVPISAELVAAVDEHLLTSYPVLDREPERDDHVWFAIWERGKRIIRVTPERQFSYRGFWEWWNRLEKAAGVRHRRPHMARHTFATDVLDATDGKGIYDLKELLGHSSIRSTETYVHSRRRRGAAAIDALLAYRRREVDEDAEAPS